MTPYEIPRLNDDLDGFDRLFSLTQQIRSSRESEIVFLFNECNFIMPNAVAVIGGLARWLQQQGKRVNFDWNSVPLNVRDQMLARNGFMEAFGYDKPSTSATAVPYREDRQPKKLGIMNYLRNEWLERGWVRVSEQLGNEIAGQMYEIYANAFEHANSDVGVISVGQYYKNNQELILAVADFGVSIPFRVRDYFGKRTITSDSALKWAFQKGTTTKSGEEMTRGVGLDLLKSFIKVNHGELEVFSSDGYACITKDEEKYEQCSSVFEGTLVNVTIQCDAKYYFLSSEQSQNTDTPWF